MFSLPVYWKQSSLSPTHLFGGGGGRTSFLTPFTGSNVPSSLPYSFIEWEKHLSFSVYWKQRSISTLLIYWGGGGTFSPLVYSEQRSIFTLLILTILPAKLRLVYHK